MQTLYMRLLPVFFLKCLHAIGGVQGLDSVAITRGLSWGIIPIVIVVIVIVNLNLRVMAWEASTAAVLQHGQNRQNCLMALENLDMVESLLNKVNEEVTEELAGYSSDSRWHFVINQYFPYSCIRDHALK